MGKRFFQENHFRDPQEEFTDALFGGGCDSTPNPSVSGPPHKGMSRALASNLVGRGVQSSSRPSQVTFLRELMLRQKVCFAKRKEFKYFPKKNHPDRWDSSQFSHFFSHLGDPGDYYRYVAVLLPDKFYWSMKKKKNLPLSSRVSTPHRNIAKLRILSCISGTLKRINMVGDLRSCPISSIILPERIALSFAMLSLY